MAKALHGMASGTYPFLGKVQPKLFAKGLAAGECAVGGIILAPFVGPVVSGAALAGFSGALLNVYWNTEGMHEPGDPRPTAQGIPMSKDVWMFGAGVGLLADGLLEPAHDKKLQLGTRASAKGRQARKAAKKLAKSNKSTAKQAKEIAKQTRAQLAEGSKKAKRKAGKKAAKATAKTAKKGGGSNGDLASNLAASGHRK